MTDDDDGFADIVEYLRGLPQGIVLRWADDHMSREQPWCASWVDVRVPEIEQAAGLSWVWTIVGPDDDDGKAGVPTVITVPHDMDAVGLWGPLPDGGDWYQDEVLIEPGTIPQPDDVARWAAKISENDAYQISRHGAWTAQRVTTAIRRWVEEHTGRTDIEFVWDPETVGMSEMAQEAVRRMKQIEDGDLQTYDLGNGIKIHPEAFQQFLEMPPEESAEFMSAIKEKLGKADEEPEGA